MVRYNVVVRCYDKMLVNVDVYVTSVPVYSAPHTHTHTANQELHMQPHLPKFYHNSLLYCILSF